MKKLLIFCLLGVALLCNSSCNKQDDASNATLEKFIQSLLNNNPDEHFCFPVFNASDIPELLEYRNDKTKISRYPANSISSFYAPGVSLGIYTLWMIEGIRIHESKSGKECLDYPSLNPRFGYRELTWSSLPNQESAQDVVAERYFFWWNTCRDQPFKYPGKMILSRRPNIVGFKV